LAGENGKKFSRFWLHHVANPPKSVAKKIGRLWSDVREEVWFGSIFQRLIVFLMISPNLHAIWVFFLLNLSQELKSVLLLYFGTLGDGYSLKGSKK
jgi:hypothetical protein